MTIHTKLVGAFDAIILSLTAAVTIVMLLVLFGASFSPSEMLMGKRGTVTIQQIAVNDTVGVRHL